MPRSTLRRFLRHGMFPQLGVFEAVARHGSFTRAAEELYMAQPTVSVQIRKLTDTIGMPLLEQVGKTVRLTPIGKELLASCEQIFQAFSDFEQKIANLRSLQAGNLDIAVSSVAMCFTSRVLVEFAKAHPAVHVRMYVGHRQSLLERMAASMDDFYLVSEPPHAADVVTLRLLPNPLVVLAHRDHPLAGRCDIPFAEFATQPLLVREPGSGARRTTEQAFADRGLVPNIRMELGSSEAILETLAAGLGVAVFPQQAVGPDLASRLTELDVEGFPLESHWHLVYPAGRPLSLIAQAFLDLVRSRALQLETEPEPTPAPPAISVSSA